MERGSNEEECSSEGEDKVYSGVDENVETFCTYEMNRSKIQPSVVVRKYESKGLSFQLWPAANAVCWYLENEFGQDGMCIPSDGNNSPLLSAVENVCDTSLEGSVVHLPGAVEDDISSRRQVFESYHRPPGNRRMNVLELGSGTGLVGIVAACLGAHVILTDLPHVLPNVEYNIELNRGAIQAAGGSVESRVLRWGVEEDIKSLGDLASFDIILASDVVYYDTLFGPLLDTLKWLVEAAGNYPLSLKERTNQLVNGGKTQARVSDPSLCMPLACSSPGKVNDKLGAVYKGAEEREDSENVCLHSRKKPPVIYLGHVRRWKKDNHFFKQASKVFDVNVIHRHPPQDNARVGPIIYRLTLKLKSQPI
ncbi:hypothetical protein R1flu_025522 [Riccia fluitans]|uniref:Uncharacterized protein n=1 Tax=Riccia fluitans TaxID=41844 RepID=A0ABD1XXZ7_9MARC